MSLKFSSWDEKGQLDFSDAAGFSKHLGTAEHNCQYKSLSMVGYCFSTVTVLNGTKHQPSVLY